MIMVRKNKKIVSFLAPLLIIGWSSFAPEESLGEESSNLGVELPPANPFSPDGRLIETEPRTAEFLVLDKITARKKKIKINNGEVAFFGTLYVRLRHCEASPPEAPMPEAKALIEVYEKPPGGGGTLKQIFNGWLFASSPAINGLEHPVYDIWPISCSARTPDK